MAVATASPTAALTAGPAAAAPTSAAAAAAAAAAQRCHTCGGDIKEKQFIRVGEFKFHKDHFTCWWDYHAHPPPFSHHHHHTLMARYRDIPPRSAGSIASFTRPIAPSPSLVAFDR